MAKIKFIEHNGTEHDVEADNGLSIMQAAVNNGIPGIVAECGGACSCATCHVVVDNAWWEKVGAPSDREESMLDLNPEREPQSRLSCQIPVTDELDGLANQEAYDKFLEGLD